MAAKPVKAAKVAAVKAAKGRGQRPRGNPVDRRRASPGSPGSPVSLVSPFSRANPEVLVRHP